MKDKTDKMISMIYLLLIPSWVAGHEHGRYSGTVGTQYNQDADDWYEIMDFDSVGQCAALCTYHACNLFETMLFDDITWDKFRGFRCYINIGTIK